MASNRSEPRLDLSSRTFNGSGSLTPYRGSSGSLTKREQGISELGQEQSLVMETQKRKADLGERLIGDLHKRAGEEFHDTASHLSEINARAAGTDYEQRVREFNDENLNHAARNLSAGVDVGAYVIGEVMAQSVVPRDEPKKKPGLIRRITGDY